MPAALSNLPPFVIPAVLGVLIFLVLVAVLRRLQAPSIDARLSQFADRGGAIQGASGPTMLTERLEAVVNRGDRSNALARDLAQADLKLTVTEFIMIRLASIMVFAAVGVFIGRASPLAMIAGGLIGALIGAIVPNRFVSFKKNQRLKAFNNQLGDTVTLLANSLRSGYSLLQSMEMVSRESAPPVSQEFRRVVQEVGLGLSLEEGLINMLRRVPSDDLDLLVTAINIQFEVGGNLADILDTIGFTIRERVRIKGQIRVLTSQARYSGYVITLLPIVVAIIITTINPEYMAPIFTFGLPPEQWCCMPVASVCMMIAGFLIIRKIVNIDI